MSQENVRIVQAGIEAYNAEDWDALLEYLAPSFVLDMSRSIGPDQRGIYGLDQMRSYLDNLRTFESARIEADEFIETGDHVVVPNTSHFRGRGGIEAEARTALVFTCQNGAVTRLVMYQGRQEALEAVGLSEQAMSHENVEIVRAVVDAYNRGDFDAGLEYAAPDSEFDWSRAVGPVHGVFKRDQMRQVLDELAEPWESVRIELDDLIEVGEHVVATQTAYQRGRDGIELRARITQVWTIRDGTIARVCLYQDRSEALEAAGLRE
jgi:ketosteroid isomerase-like protein